MDVEDIRRFNAQADLLAYLSARLSHEDSTRHLHWSWITFYGGLLVITFGSATAVLIGTIGRPDLLSRAACYSAATTLVLAFVTLQWLMILLRAKYKRLPHKTRAVIDWIKTSDSAADQRAMLIQNLAGVADDIDDENRSRGKGIRVAKWLTAISIYLVLLAGALRVASHWSVNDVEGQQRFTQEATKAGPTQEGANEAQASSNAN